MEHDSGHVVLLSEITGRPRADAPPEENDLVRRYVDVLRQIQIDSLDVVVEALFFRDVPVRLSEASILVDHSIYVDMFQEVRLQPLLDQINIFRVTMREYHRVLGVPVDKEHLHPLARGRMEVNMIGVHGEARDWRLEKQLRNKDLTHLLIKLIFIFFSK